MLESLTESLLKVTYNICVIPYQVKKITYHDHKQNYVRWHLNDFAFFRCGHCRKLAPTWAELAELLNGDEESRVKIARVDCTESSKTCTDNDITSYPTLKFFHVNSADEPVKYKGSRDLPALTQFVSSMNV